MADVAYPELPSTTPGIKIIKDYPNGTTLIECHHDSSQIVGVICGICRQHIEWLDKPVKMVVRITAGTLL